MKAKESELRVVRFVAGWIRTTQDWYRRAAKAAKGSSQERAFLKYAANGERNVGICICNFGSGRFHRLLAAELEGKPAEIYRAGWYDEIIDAALRAVTFRSVNGHLDINPDAPFSEFKKAFEREWEKRGKQKEQMPSYRSLHRSWKRRKK